MTTPRPLDALLFASSGDVWLGTEMTCVEYTNASFGPRVACLGENGSGQLGIDSTTNVSAPTDVMTRDTAGTTGWLTEVRDMAIGGAFTCALLASGSVTCWGSAGYYVFGEMTTANRRVAMIDAVVPRLP